MRTDKSGKSRAIAAAVMLALASMAGLPRVGAARAALVSTVEPVITVLLAVVILGERLSAVQVVGGVLVLLAVILVQAAHMWKSGLPNALK